MNREFSELDRLTTKVKGGKRAGQDRGGVIRKAGRNDRRSFTSFRMTNARSKEFLKCDDLESVFLNICSFQTSDPAGLGRMLVQNE